MTKEQIIKDLQSLIRQSEDAILINEVTIATFHPLFDAAYDNGHYNDEKTYDRAMELHHNATNKTTIVNMKKDIAVFQAAIDTIKEYQIVIANLSS